MSKFVVVIERKVVQVVEIEVEADSLKDAEAKASDLAGDIDFSGKEKEAEYEVTAYSKPLVSLRGA